MAGQEAHVYKYADRSTLFYQCQISITIKEPNSECARPQCSEPNGFNAVKLGANKDTANPAASNLPVNNSANSVRLPTSVRPARPSLSQLRLLKKREAGFDNTLDVRTELSALDISNQV